MKNEKYRIYSYLVPVLKLVSIDNVWKLIRPIIHFYHMFMDNINTPLIPTSSIQRRYTYTIYKKLVMVLPCPAMDGKPKHMLEAINFSWQQEKMLKCLNLQQLFFFVWGFALASQSANQARPATTYGKLVICICTPIVG